MNKQINKLIQNKKYRWLLTTIIIVLFIYNIYALINIKQNKSAQKINTQNNNIKNSELSKTDNLIIHSKKNEPIKSNQLDEKKSETELETKLFTSTKYNFLIQYPKSFFNLGVFELPPTQKPIIAIQTFSSQNVTSPMDMDDNGIWITIRVSENKNNLGLTEFAAKASTNPEYTIISQVQNLIINDQSAVKQIEDFRKTEGTENGYSEVTYFKKGKFIYSIKGMTIDSKIFNNFKTEYDKIINSFQLIN